MIQKNGIHTFPQRGRGKIILPNGKIVLAGNSIGGVVACQTAKNLEDQAKHAEKLILIDCAQREIDDKRLSEQPPFRRLLKPLLKKLVRQRWLTRTLYKTKKINNTQEHMI